jgi:hypothetical protein
VGSIAYRAVGERLEGGYVGAAQAVLKAEGKRRSVLAAECRLLPLGAQGRGPGHGFCAAMRGLCLGRKCGRGQRRGGGPCGHCGWPVRC